MTWRRPSFCRVLVARGWRISPVNRMFGNREFGSIELVGYGNLLLDTKILDDKNIPACPREHLLPPYCDVTRVDASKLLYFSIKLL